MGDIKLKLSDGLLQQKLETIFMQFGWTIVRRSVSEDKDMPPQITYKLEDGSGYDDLREHVERIGYGFADDPSLTIKGQKSALLVVVRQLAPTDTTRSGGLKTFGDGGDE